MTTIRFELPDQQAAQLAKRAAAQGLSIESFFRILAETEASPRRYTAEELVAQCEPDCAQSDEDRAWLDAPPVGREAL